jgi:hypothetical protein
MNPFKNRAITIASALLIVIVFSVSLPAATPTDAPVPPPASTPKPASSSLSPVQHLGNSHLHGVARAVTKSAGTTALTPKKTTAKAKVRVRHWTFTEWAELHRGLGTVRGEVHNPSGSTMSGVQVSLRSSKGKVLKPSSRHVTHTNGSGSFVMKHVRIGSYRVRGTKGKASGHVGVKVHGGQMTSASLKV